MRVRNTEKILFCCEGCARVYEVARDAGLLAEVLQHTSTAVNPKPEKILQSGIHPSFLKPGESAYFDIDGMWCAGCALAAERVLQNQPGVKDASVSFAAERGRIEYDPAQVNPEGLMKKLTPLGYRAHITSSKEEQQKERFQNRIGLQLMAATAFGMEIMVLYLVQLYPMYALGLYNSIEARRIQYVVWAMSTPVVFYGGLTFLSGTWRSLRAKTVGMDMLVALGVLSAYLYSAYITLTGNGQTYFDSAAMIVDFILIGRYLEVAGGAQARKDLRSLLRLQPEFAWQRGNLSGDDWQQVRVETLVVGDTILIKPGERVSADSKIVEGSASLDESLLTGESLPVTKRPGDMIYAGTVSREGALICQVIQPPATTRLSQITTLVSQTLSQKPRIQRLADRASTYFTYAILILAGITFAGWLLKTHSSGAAVMAAVAVLVVACPCALGLATPLAMTVTMGHAARHGILIRSPEALETSTSIQRIAFDKTGTLTLGQPSVVEAVPTDNTGFDRDTLVRLAASVEQYSEHPLARAIVRASHDLLPSSEFITLRGAGASARVEYGNIGQRITVGSTRLINTDYDSNLMESARQRAALGETVVWVASNDHVAGFISLRDQPNPTALEALQILETNGIHTVMLSGDSPLVVQAIAQELGIQSFEGTCSPEDKAAKIASWQQSGQRVGMVGDGVNDAPALAQANLSITTAGGTDIAGQASDLVLTRPDLTLIPWFIQLSHKTRRAILQNLGWAFAYNLVSVPLAMIGKINPVIAAVTMALSSLLVVANSLRLRNL